MAQHEADLAVAQADQVLGQGEGGGLVVDEHAGALVAIGGGGDPHMGDAQPIEHRQRRRVVRDRRGGDHAVQAQAGDDLFDLPGDVAARVDRLDRQMVAGLAAAEQGADLGLGDVAVVGIVVEEADQARTAADQAAGGDVGLVVERRSRRQHALAYLLADMGLAVEHPRHGLEGHLGPGGDVFDRRLPGQANLHPRGEEALACFARGGKCRPHEPLPATAMPGCPALRPMVVDNVVRFDLTTLSERAHLHLARVASPSRDIRMAGLRYRPRRGKR